MNTSIAKARNHYVRYAVRRGIVLLILTYGMVALGLLVLLLSGIPITRDLVDRNFGWASGAGVFVLLLALFQALLECFFIDWAQLSTQLDRQDRLSNTDVMRAVRGAMKSKGGR